LRSILQVSCCELPLPQNIHRNLPLIESTKSIYPSFAPQNNKTKKKPGDNCKQDIQN
jgi:hypothetical protein